jgi:hypothetical protein
MASAAVMQAVSARLAALWSTTPVVVDDTTGQGTPDGAPYVTVEYPLSRENQITIGSPGNNVWREDGAIRLVLVNPTGSGLVAPLATMDQLRALFRGKQFAGVTTFAPSPPVVDPTNYQGGRFKVTSAVPYYFDLFA